MSSCPIRLICSWERKKPLSLLLMILTKGARRRRTAVLGRVESLGRASDQHTSRLALS